MTHISNLRKSIFYLQEAIRHDHPNDAVLMDILNQLTIVDKQINLNTND